MRSLTCIVVLATVCGALSQIAVDELCAGCVFENGAAYNNHSDCTKFVQCLFNSDGHLFGTVRHCPFSTYWDMNTLNCSPSKDTKCPSDFCKDKTESYEYKAETNCRGFWRCNNEGKSVPMCCPADYLYDSLTMSCIKDLENVCNDTCFSVYEPPQPTICDKFPVPGYPTKYQQDVAGWPTMILDCAPGSVFIASDCRCLGIVNPIVDPKCYPEIYLPFTDDHTDQSKYPTTVMNINVKVKDGVAIFNGKNSRLIIPRFTNLGHMSTVIIRAKYKSAHHTFTGMARALVVNSDCGNLPSIMLSEDETNKYFGVSTNEKQFVFTNITQDQDATSETEKYVEFRFQNGYLSGSDGDITSTVKAPGYLRNVRCALQIGYADNLLPFEGTIDELTIYLCNPDS